MRSSVCVLSLLAVAGLVGLAGCGSKRQAEPEAGERGDSAPSRPGVAPESAAPEPAAEIDGPQVELVNKDYDRLRSRVLIRRLHRATKANLELAVYDSNIMTYDPKEYAPTPPEEKPKLAGLDFGGALVKGSLVDRIDGTPLADAEKNGPVAWTGVSEHLLEWDFDKALALAEVGAKISDEKWNDDDVPIAYQEITRIYLHEAEGTVELWARVEFTPWVKFLADVDDEDGDGFPELYGKFPQGLVTEDILAEIEAYRGEVFSGEDIKFLATEIGTQLYPKYNTETLDPDELAVWPDNKVMAEFGDELRALGNERPTIVIEGRPFKKTLYNVFIIEGLEKQ